MEKRTGYILVILLVIIIILSPGSNTYVHAAQSWSFGVPDPNDIALTLNPPPVLNKQGTNNFYFYYSKDNNIGGKVSESTMIECEFAVNKNSYAQKFFVPKLDDVKPYYEVEFPALYPGENVQFWWRIDKYGISCPAGNMSAIVAFKAPDSGEYEIEAYCSGGARPDQGNVADLADGVTFAINKGDTNLWSFNTNRELHSYEDAISVPKQKFELKAGQAVYFVVDPNETFENDMGHWYINVTQLSVKNEPSPNDNKDEPESNDTKNEPGSQNNSDSYTPVPDSNTDTHSSDSDTNTPAVEENTNTSEPNNTEPDKESDPSIIPEATPGADTQESIDGENEANEGLLQQEEPAEDTLAEDNTSPDGTETGKALWLVWVIGGIIILSGIAFAVYKILLKKKDN